MQDSASQFCLLHTHPQHSWPCIPIMSSTYPPTTSMALHPVLFSTYPPTTFLTLHPNLVLNMPAHNIHGSASGFVCYIHTHKNTRLCIQILSSTCLPTTFMALHPVLSSTYQPTTFMALHPVLFSTYSTTTFMALHPVLSSTYPTTTFMALHQVLSATYPPTKTHDSASQSCPLHSHPQHSWLCIQSCPHILILRWFFMKWSASSGYCSPYWM